MPRPYNPRMAPIPDSVRDFLATGPLAHVVTLAPDGTPHVSLAWAGFDGDEVVLATFFPDQHKIHNLRRDPRISLSFQANEYTGEGLHPYVVIRGRATVTEDGALPVMDRLAAYYIGPGATYPMRDFPDGAVIHVTVEKIYGTGPWREDGDVPA
jgi:PPOX class probable F420-dependent enzyme